MGNYWSTDLESLSIQDLISTANSIPRKNINPREINDHFANYDLKSRSILPISVELLYELNKMPLFTPNLGRYRRYKKTISPKFDVGRDTDQVLKSNDRFFFFSDRTPILYSFVLNQISIPEFNAAFKNAPNKKDFLGMSKPILRGLTDYIKQRIILEYNRLLMGGVHSNSHAIGISYLIYKESKAGPIDNPESFRTITTIPTIVNHFHRIIMTRISDYFLKNKIIDTCINKGCIPNITHPILEQIIKVRATISDSRDNGKPLYIMFVDFSNAFPSLDRDKLFLLLKKYKIPIELIQYIQRYYDDLQTSIQISRNKRTELKKWTQGLIQGCPMSPFLFVIVMNYILKNIMSYSEWECGYNLYRPLLFMAYLDDICITANSYKSLGKIYERLTMLCSVFGLKINRTKTKIMAPSPNDTMDNIEVVDSFKYLGETITWNGDLTGIYRQIFRELFRKLYRVDKATYDNETKLSVFSSSILPWLQRKLVVYYDLDTQLKQNIYKVVYYFTNKKWGYDGNFRLMNPYYKTLQNSTDYYINQLVTNTQFTEIDQEIDGMEALSGNTIFHKFTY